MNVRHPEGVYVANLICEITDIISILFTSQKANSRRIVLSMFDHFVGLVLKELS